MATSDGPNDNRRIRQVGFGFAIFWLVMSVTVLILDYYWLSRQEWFYKDVLREHLQVIVGVPEIAAASFIIVVFLRQTDGPIEFEGLGFKFKGAAGQVIMWILTCLAMAGAIKLLW